MHFYSTYVVSTGKYAMLIILLVLSTVRAKSVGERIYM